MDNPLDYMISEGYAKLDMHYRRKPLPDYYDGMYRDGYTYQEVLEAAHRTMLKQEHTRRKAEEEKKKRVLLEKELSATLKHNLKKALKQELNNIFKD